MITISADQLINLVTSAQFLDNVIRCTAVATAVLSFVSNMCSILANYIPDPHEQDISNKVAKISKVVNFLAINAKKLKNVNK